MKDILNRTLNIGDYFLYCIIPWDFSVVAVGKVEQDGNYYVRYDGKLVCVSSKDTTDIPICFGTKSLPKNVYKLNGDNNLFDKYYNLGRNVDEFGDYYYGVSLHYVNMATDIFGRPVNIGDFVMFKKNGAFTPSGVYFGVLIDSSHVLTPRNTKEKCKYVYKIGSRDIEESKLYKQVAQLYNESLQVKLQHTERQAPKVGDLYRKNNYALLFLGVYISKIEGTNNPILNSYGRKEGLYLIFNLKRKRDVDYLEELKSGKRTEVDEFIKNSNYHYSPDCFMVSEKPLNKNYIGHVDIKTNNEYVYNSKSAKYTYKKV